jgi:hypothetical protein
MAGELCSLAEPRLGLLVTSDPPSASLSSGRQGAGPPVGQASGRDFPALRIQPQLTWEEDSFIESVTRCAVGKRESGEVLDALIAHRGEGYLL